MSSPIVVLGTTSLWPTTGDTGYSAQALQLQQLLASAVDPIKGLYNTSTGHVGQLAINNSDQLTLNGLQVGGVLSFNSRTGTVTLTSSDVTTALGYTPGTGSVSSVSGTNGVTVATGTTTPMIGLGDIAPTGNITLASSKKYEGDFTSSASSGTKTVFQTTTTNGKTVIAAIPNGIPSGVGNTNIGFIGYAGSDPANSGYMAIWSDSSSGYSSIQSAANGTGTILPIQIQCGTSGNALVISTSNNVSITHNLSVTGTITGSNLSGTNTGDQTLNSLLPTQTGNSGKYLTTDGTNSSWAAVSGTGTVTSVAISGSNGIGVASSPITTSGTIALSLGAITPSSVSPTGNLVMASGTLIQGDFSNATASNRTAIQTSTTNGFTAVSVIPNGTSTTAALQVESGQLTNDSVFGIQTDGTTNKLLSSKRGTGTVLPILISTDGTNGLTVSTSNNVSISGDLSISTAGKGLKIKEGSNAKMGQSTLVAGTVTVSNTSVTSNSRIFLTIASLGTVSIPATVAITSTTPGTGFTITSANVVDTSVINWQIFEAA